MIYIIARSRQRPPAEKRLPFREALKKPREAFKKTKEQMSSFLKIRTDGKRTNGVEETEIQRECDKIDQNMRKKTSQDLSNRNR